MGVFIRNRSGTLPTHSEDTSAEPLSQGEVGEDEQSLNPKIPSNTPILYTDKKADCARNSFALYLYYTMRYCANMQEVFIQLTCNVPGRLFHHSSCQSNARIHSIISLNISCGDGRAKTQCICLNVYCASTVSVNLALPNVGFEF